MSLVLGLQKLLELTPKQKDQDGLERECLTYKSLWSLVENIRLPFPRVPTL